MNDACTRKDLIIKYYLLKVWVRFNVTFKDIDE